jgi:serine phosphatase RsbU (regulator of sigma subunit)
MCWTPDGRGRLQFAFRYQPTAALAGDFFHILELADSEAGLFVCDVMGHGVRAALVTAFLRGLIEELTAFAGDPGAFLSEINRRLVAVLRRTDSFMFASAFYAVADLAEGRLRYANAGHPEALQIRRQSGEVGMLGRDSREPEPALGLIERFTYGTDAAPLGLGDIVLLYTDGIYEATSPDGQQYGEERLARGVRRRVDRPPDVLLDELVSEVRAFAKTPEFADDVCLVTMELADVGKQATARRGDRDT